MKLIKQILDIMFGQGDVHFTLAGIPIGYYFITSSVIGAILGVVLVKILL
jgi:hypothetical protein